MKTPPKPGDIHAYQPEWLPLVEEMRRRGTTRDLPRPPAGLADGGKYRMPTYATAKALYRRALVYSVNGKEQTLGYFHTDQLTRVARPPKPCSTDGKIISINGHYDVRVCIDDTGLPAPVPLEYWKRIRALSLASHLLDGAEQSWPIEDVYRFLENDGWIWDGEDWKEDKPWTPSLATSTGFW